MRGFGGVGTVKLRSGCFSTMCKRGCFSASSTGGVKCVESCVRRVGRALGSERCTCLMASLVCAASQVTGAYNRFRSFLSGGPRARKIVLSRLSVRTCGTPTRVCGVSTGRLMEGVSYSVTCLSPPCGTERCVGFCRMLRGLTE